MCFSILVVANYLYEKVGGARMGLIFEGLPFGWSFLAKFL
ncbi:ornithine cyclodeaminase [Bacillus sp. UFRGS-B20]|nr:ornithine cyclodeaminase [Bacillus sp. UFRGS-B20]